MNYKEYQELSSKTFADANDETLNLLHCAIGASTEAGELLDAFKKHIYYKKELDVVNIGEEIADIQWYLFNLCRLLDLDMEQLLEANIAKLKARYGEKFSSEKAISRDLETERIILENGVVVSENRELENGGMKPPKNEWLSYSETLSVQEKEQIKQEARRLVEAEEVIELESPGLFKLSDVGEAFGYLEDFDGHITFSLVSSKEQIDKASELIGSDLSKYQDKLNKVEYISLVACDFNVQSDSEFASRFVVLLEFSQLKGSLKMIKILHDPSEKISTETEVELDKYLNQYGIEK